MCRLLGIYGKIDFWQEIVMEFRKQAESGNIPPVKGTAPGHKDGWGMAGSNDDKTAMVPVARHLGSALESPLYRESVDLWEGRPHIFLGHLRKASENIPVSLANVHPFFHDGWAFIHNGTVYDAESLPRHSSLMRTSDDSDTEFLFHYLLTAIMTKPGNKRIGETLAGAVASMKTDYTSINSILSNGKKLYVIRGYKRWEEYYTLFCYSLPTGFIICSERIDSGRLDQTRWVPLANNSLFRIHGSPPRIDRIPLSNNSQPGRAGTK